MSVHVLADGARGPVGVLVDDPVCGRLLLDCGSGVPTAAAFAGISLAGVRVLTTGDGPHHLDPGVPAAAVLTEHPCAARVDAGAGRRAILLTTSRGVLLHHPAGTPLPPDAVPPGARATLAGFGLPLASSTRRVLVTGGSRSGKSALAERLLAAHGDVVYLATGPQPGGDEEWAARLAAHRDRRPPTWSTVETTDATAALADGAQPVLLDSVGTWLTAAMDDAGTWEGRGDDRLGLAVDSLVDTWARSGRDVVAVTEEVGSGVVPATVSGRRFADELGRLNARLAAAADEVWLVTVGVGQRLK
ncbi:MAG: bifunctional adenosylcobinamide kinase/adenosylcobinamide-phosphate guanylyltransferase [Mycobacteriaceae bacterium]